MVSLVSHWTLKFNQKNNEQIDKSDKEMGLSLYYKDTDFAVSKKGITRLNQKISLLTCLVTKINILSNSLIKKK